MCGIQLCVIRKTSSAGDRSFLTLPQWLLRRGPDVQCTVEWETASHTHVILRASVLGMREKLSSQPVPLLEDKVLQISRQVYFSWNGEVYQSCNGMARTSITAMTSTPISEENPGDPSISDTDFVADLIRQRLENVLVHNIDNKGMNGPLPNVFLPHLADVFSQLVNAEFSFCVATTDWIYYGKDSWGRRSLLTSATDANGGNCWTLSSVATSKSTSWTEVEPGIIFAYNVNDGSTQQIAYRPMIPLSRRILNNISSMDSSDTLLFLLRRAVRRRTTGRQPVAVLFSGGLDSVVLAALVIQECSRVILANVSFVKHNASAPITSSAADTRAAIESYQQLKQLFPDAKVNFCQRQVEWSEIEREQDRIRDLIYPKTTVMDLNIATAFWFASETVTDSRKLLTGLGADEQMGGYGRHRKAWERGGVDALRLELQKDQERLWERNLGRDDRVLSDTSKEARYPYLDTDVVEFLRHLDLDEICDFNLPAGQGDKKILRQLAHRLGLVSASCAVKRAVQFGSRIAHVSDKIRFGSRRKASGEADYDGNLED